MKITGRLYDVSLVMDALIQLSENLVGDVLHSYVVAGANPYFLQQCIEWRCFAISGKSKNRILNKTTQVLKASFRKESLRSSWAQGLMRGVSRVYAPGWVVIESVSEGELVGAFLESWIIAKDLAIKSRCNDEWLEAVTDLLNKVLDHPSVTVGCFDTVTHLFHCLCEELDTLGIVNPVSIKKLLDYGEFVKKHLSRVSADVLIEQAISLMHEKTSHRFWWFMGSILRVMSNDEAIRLLILPSIVIRQMLSLSEGENSRLRHSALLFRNLFPCRSDDADFFDRNAFASVASLFFDQLRAEVVSDIAAKHLVVAWLKVITSEARAMLLINIAMVPSQHSILEDTEDLVEQVAGQEVWKALCSFQDPKMWITDPSLLEGSSKVVTLPERSAQKTFFDQKMLTLDLSRHDSVLAGEADSLVYQSAKHVEAIETADDMLNMLAGDIVMSVSHLRRSGLNLRRRSADYYGNEFPVVTVRTHPSFGDVGCACSFSVKVRGVNHCTIDGQLDPEGLMKLDNLIYLSSLGRQVIKAVVLESMACVLLPTFVNATPVSSGRGNRVNFTGEVWAARPIIHEQIDLTYEPDEVVHGSSGIKINPIIATRLFEWLLSVEPLPYEFRLFQLVEEAFDGKNSDECYRYFADAKALLLSGNIKPSELFFRTRRAHTRPVSLVYDKANQIVVQKRMSSKARRNYSRYMQDHGRSLDFERVEKTCILPNGMRVVMDVEKTFVVGSFASLEEIWSCIPDSSLKALARQALRL